MKIFNKTNLPESIEYNGNTYVPDYELSRKYKGLIAPEVKGIIAVHVLAKNLKGKTDLHGHPYEPTYWIYRQTFTNITPKVSKEYEVGAILSFSWGYEQTNYNFYCITKVENDWITLVEMTKNVEWRGDMHTSETPKEIDPKGNIIRRKLKRNRDNNRPIGLQIERYGWGALWDGEPEQATHYA